MSSNENTFEFRAINGLIDIGSEFNKHRFNERKKKGGRGRIIFDLPESRKQRKFFEGGLIPLAVYFQDNLNYQDNSDCELFRNYIIGEVLGYDIKIVKDVKTGKFVQKKKRRSSKGSENLNQITEYLIDYLVTEYAVNQDRCMNPDKYKIWRDEVYPFGGPDNYIDYLILQKDLQSK